MQDKEYIAILQQSLEKKNRILDLIVEKNKEQRILFTDETLPPERLEENIKEKGDLVDQLNQLDDGFEQVYNRVREILNKEKEAYRDEMLKLLKRVNEFDYIFPGHFLFNIENTVIQSFVDTANAILADPMNFDICAKDDKGNVTYQKNVRGMGTIAYRANNVYREEAK